MMKVAFDTSPLKTGSCFRGVGMYTKKLLEFLQKERDLQIMKFDNGRIPGEANLIHYPYFFPFLLSLPIFPPKKFVVTVHDLTPLVFPQAYPPGLKGQLRFLIQKELLKKASMIMADSQSSSDDIVKFIGYPKGKIRVVYLAAANKVARITDKKLLQAIKTKFGLPETFVLYVGDVNYNKNLPGLVKACRLIKIPLVIVGKQAVSGDFEAGHIENQPLLELNDLTRGADDVIRTGFVDEAELAGLYSLAALYCQPSFYEGFGLPILEAMSCQCPVITSNLGSMKEIAGEAAVYVNPHDIADIGNGIKKIIEDKSLRTKIINAGFEQAKKFSWEKTAKETIRVYEKIFTE